MLNCQKTCNFLRKRQFLSKNVKTQTLFRANFVKMHLCLGKYSQLLILVQGFHLQMVMPAPRYSFQEMFVPPILHFYFVVPPPLTVICTHSDLAVIHSHSQIPNSKILGVKEIDCFRFADLLYFSCHRYYFSSP